MIENINWAELERRAAAMTTEQLHAAIAAIRETLAHADELDRATGSDNGGRYRDEASVYHRELRRRERSNACPTCGRS